ncbi:hypothetical protein G7Z17_g4280 [Cylindrodendrum hubeiense]|uniref:Xylanolytic transcriptional activator regulatory domain-containing protein n=1 Tax=Cylindrodendrum hubeiense TaxID=595255 RepID=A0A9P5HE99_9HYPO|nr:hypothetical protein G7Z17_g4280 [Cylindrodendrum hubeiense]
MPAQGKQVKFVASDPNRGGLPVKRKQVQHACAACRRKKRRCIHAEDSADDPASLIPTTAPGSVTDEPAGQESPAQPSPMSTGLDSSAQPRTQGLDGQESGATNPSVFRYDEPPSAPVGVAKGPPSITTPNAQSSRFVGDLNPEGMFVEATGSASIRETSQKGDVGIWLSSALGAASQGSQFVTSRPPAIMDQFLLPFVKEHCLSCLPPDKDYRELKSVFLQKIYPIFPIIPRSSLEGSPDSPSDIVLRQLVCLAAAPDPTMSHHLRLRNRGADVLSSQEFMQCISSAVRAILETSIIPDRVLHVRALIMLSLYTQPSSTEEADLPAQLGGRAIHHIQTLGLHLLRYESDNGEDWETLFCAVWALDRINAAFYGRPCIMHERDIGANLDACIKRRPPCFRLLLSVCQWLDQVIELYRPGPSAEASGFEKIAYIDLPVLEAMIVDADALKVSTPLIVPRDNLSPVPFIPYAVSLALSVEYRKMRHSRLPMFRSRAMHAFKRNCEMLRDFGDYFWSANVVAGLGERVLKEMERAATNITKEITPPPPETPGSAPPSSQAAVPRPSEVVMADPTTLNSAAGIDNPIDFSLIDAISGQDVFGHIDPSFNLNAVEDALEANLDIGLPINWGEWGQFTT